MSAAAIAVGINDATSFGDGWHERQRDGRAEIPYRATGKSATIHLRILPEARTLHLLLAAPCGLAGESIVGTLHVGDAPAVPLRIECDVFVLRNIPIPRDSAGETMLHFSVANPVVPDRILRNGDGRTLGFYLSAVWQS